MADAFLELGHTDRLEALQVAAFQSGRPAYILEKDVWVVWTLRTLFDSPFGGHLVFKGGTSLSKAYKVIQRFSEDIDVTYDIRVLAEDLVNKVSNEPTPTTRSQSKRWTDAVRSRLPGWLAGTVLPYIERQIRSEGIEATARIDAECIYLEYAPSIGGYGYVAPRVKIEFGARSTGEPADTHRILCDAADFLPTLELPTAHTRVMRVERTAWEKMIAIHVFCLQRNIKDRLSRHWYDVARLDAAGLMDGALKDQDIAQRVATHKSWAFYAKDSTGRTIDYHSAVNNALTLVPRGPTLDALAQDYAKMVEDGLFLGDPEDFSWVLARCQSVEQKANSRA